MHYIYCPQCGAKLKNKIAGDDGYVPYCEECEQYWFDSFPSCSIVLVANEYNEIALLRQSYLSDKYSSFVSGYIAVGENAEQTAIREVKEELGIDVDRIEYAGTYWFNQKGLLMHGFIALVKKTEFKLSSEVDSAQWISVFDAPKYMFPDSPDNTMFPIYRQYIDKYLK